MTKWIGAAILAVTVMFAGPATIKPAAASPKARVSAVQVSHATDLSAGRRARHYRDGYRPYYRPYYYERPYYYRPYPYYGPAPFAFGFGPWW
jgi:hypothetical protein